MKKLLLPFCAALLVAACGHGSNSSGSAPSEDDVASMSLAGLVAFAEAQIARTDADVIEPRALAGITPPASDVDEPAAI